MAVEAQLAEVFPDGYWAAASAAAKRALDEADRVLVPAEFLSLDARFAPLEYSWGLEGAERLAWCCSKDDVDRLAPWLRDAARGESHYAWANEVFVLGGNFAWRRAADADSKRHLTAWLERVDRYRAGTPARPAGERRVTRDARTVHTLPGRRVLVIGASAMGNVGDDLLAQVLAEMLIELGAEVYLSGPDVDPLRVSAYDAIVVGGGGLLYAGRGGAVETQNLANYLKFGPIGRAAGVPTALIGVGDQDHAHVIERDPLTRRFARATVPQFDEITTRDADSAALLERLGASAPGRAGDLVFRWLERARAAVKPTTGQGRIALVGELFRYSAFERAFASGAALPPEIQDADYDLLVMSDDDVAHAERMRAKLQSLGSGAAIVDLRGRDFDALVFSFASYAGVVTTRFHGLILAALTGVPVLAFDVPGGKNERLLRELGATQCLQLDHADGAAADRLAAALAGDLAAIPRARLGDLVARSRIHEAALGRLLGLADSTAAPVGPKRSAARARPDAAARLAGLATVPLCWAASTAETRGYANLGDSLSAVIVAALAGRPVRHVSFDADQTKLIAVGSIGHAIKDGTAVVWGAGVSIRGGVLAANVPRTRYDVRAIRGRISAQHYRDFGIDVPDVYGDPVWFLPSIVDEPVEQRYELGVIPHIRDVADHHPDAPAKSDSLRYVVDAADAGDVAVINTWHEPTWEGLLAKIRLIRSCKRIVSQSFHGVVIAETYGIPVLNFRYQLRAKNGPLRVDLTKECRTDPRVFEFFDGGPRRSFYMYSQRRDERTNWQAVMRAVDELWQPFEVDAAPLAASFPLPLAYDPLRERIGSAALLQDLRF
jgi:polysaccharide pyruvyl transferase WcaK-like protein